MNSYNLYKPMNKKINACIIGLGRAGRFHLTSLKRLESFQLQYIVDPNLKPTDEVLASNGLTLVDEKTAFADPNLDAVIVSSPTGFHFTHIMQALSSGKHVFAEKPLGKSLDEINRCYELAAEKSLALHLGFQRRLDHNFVALKRSLGNMGQVKIIKASSRDNPRPPIDYLKISGNIFHDMLIHDFDMLSFLLGPLIPESIYAMGHCYDPAIRNIPDFDTVMVNLYYPNGLMCCIDTSRTAAYGYDQRIEVFADKGMAIAENEKNSTVRLFTETGMHLDKIQHSFPQRYKESYLNEMVQFAKGIHTKQLYSVTRQECILSHLIAEAAYESATSFSPVKFQSNYESLLS